MSYVYILCDENDIPFYVGKGTGDRIFQHEMESIERTHNLLKYNKIHEIMDRGYQVKKYIVHSGLTESEAYACELALTQQPGDTQQPADPSDAEQSQEQDKPWIPPTPKPENKGPVGRFSGASLPDDEKK